MQPATDRGNKVCMHRRVHGLAQQGRVIVTHGSPQQEDPQGMKTLDCEFSAECS